MLYDGVCALCNRLVRFLLEHDRRGVCRFAALGSAAGRAAVERFGGDPNELSSVHVIAHYRTERAQLLSRSRAALFVAGELGWPWSVARLAGILPTALLDRAYDIVARSRYRVFGRFDRCPVRPAEFRRRFIDEQ